MKHNRVMNPKWPRGKPVGHMYFFKKHWSEGAGRDRVSCELLTSLKGSFSNVDGHGSENVTFKMNSRVLNFVGFIPMSWKWQM